MTSLIHATPSHPRRRPTLRTRTRPRPIRLLVADDQPFVRDGLASLLAVQPDFEVVAEAASGDEVLDLLPECKPDILLLDLRMPGGDGLSMLQKLQRYRAKPRVILLTAPGDESACSQAMRLGACGIVPKQIATECLVECIRQVHSGEIWLDARTATAMMEESALPPQTVTDERSALSRRERQIVALVAQGMKNKQIAERLFISDQTVKNHLHNIFYKVGAGDRLELALYAIQNRIGTSEILI